MRLAIMQPYFLPYIGYFQLMAAVDRFVILDDVNYIKGGWINRNRLPARNGTMWLTLPLVGASPNRIIREIEILPDNGWKRAMERTVALTYAEATGSGVCIASSGSGWHRRPAISQHFCLAAWLM